MSVKISVENREIPLPGGAVLTLCVSEYHNCSLSEAEQHGYCVEVYHQDEDGPLRKVSESIITESEMLSIRVPKEWPTTPWVGFDEKYLDRRPYDRVS